MYFQARQLAVGEVTSSTPFAGPNLGRGGDISGKNLDPRLHAYLEKFPGCTVEIQVGFWGACSRALERHRAI